MKRGVEVREEGLVFAPRRIMPQVTAMESKDQFWSGFIRFTNGMLVWAGTRLKRAS